MDATPAAEDPVSAVEPFSRSPPGSRPDPVAVRREAPVEVGAGVTLHATFYDNPPMIEAVSEGLIAFGQTELVMAIRLYEDSDRPYLLRELGTFFRTVGRLAQQGMLVSDGGRSEFGPNPPFAQGIGGVLYSAEGSRLRGTLVQRPEIAVAKMAGVYRILTRLGAQARHFPYPQASDLRRPPVARDNESSMLERMATARGQEVTAVLDGELVRWTVRSLDAEWLEALIARTNEDGVVAWLTTPDPTASNRFFWHPNQQEPSAISGENPANTRISGWFFIVILHQQADEIRLFEDGFLLMLTDATWEKLCAALRNQEPFVMPAQGEGLGLVLSWHDGLDVYHPREPGPRSESRQVVLLSPEDVFQRALPMNALSQYINQVFSAAEEARSLLDEPNVAIMVRLELRPKNHLILSVQTVPPQGVPQDFAEAIFQVKVPPVQENVLFQLVLREPDVVH